MNKIIIFFLFFFSCLPLFCRDVAVKVIDADLDLPLEGATIRARDGNEYKCNHDGIAVVKAPDDRQLVIQVIYPGYETGTFIIPAAGNSLDVYLGLSGVMQGNELVVEAQKPGANETKTGRSVAISGREIAQSAEIGVIEDVMNAIKLLPGVGYSGTFNAQPSIRGGFPGDMSASLDGFYVFNPYHWGGGVSIFDPRMIQSAQLSHGVFSTRFGHTMSGLLDMTTKNPSPSETEFEIGMSTSAANFNLSFPFAGKGGILIMGRTTYYDPIIALAQELSKYIDDDQFDAVNSIRVAPYIRSGTITGNYRFTSNLELRATGFFGMDGVGVTFINEPETDGLLTSKSSIIFDFTNYQGFIITNLNWNPSNNTLFKFSLGSGYTDAQIAGDMNSSVYKENFSEPFLDKYKITDHTDRKPYESKMHIEQSEIMFNAQGRIDFDWELFDGFLISTGVQEMFTRYSSKGEQQGAFAISFDNFEKNSPISVDLYKERIIEYYGLDPNDNDDFWKDLYLSVYPDYNPKASNNLFTTSGYILNEANIGSRIKTELGLRLDHYYLAGEDFSLQSTPALSPRLNIDFNLLKNKGILESFDISLGTGLFSAMDNNVFMAEKRFNLKDIQPNRAWTSVAGTKFEFPQGLSFNIEGYYKYIFNRMYIPVTFSSNAEDGTTGVDPRPKNDGQGIIWGIDVMLQKMQSRFWDGWISYSYSYARYLDPSSENANTGLSGGRSGSDWYFPWFHRYHNLNLVLNIKPTNKINIYTRFGIASGTQRSRRIGDSPVSYPVLNDPFNPADPGLIERYRWPSERDENYRTPLTLPMDIKFSFFGSNKTGKSRYEIYFALENVLALVYRPERDTSFNTYTGEVDTGSSNATYGIPIPIPSFGFKLSY